MTRPPARHLLTALVVVVMVGVATAWGVVAAGRGSEAEGTRARGFEEAAAEGAVAGGARGGPTSTVAPVVVDHRLFAVGDSVLQGAAPRLVDELDDWELTVDTRVGRFLDEGIRVVRRHRRDLGEVAVVALGNNYGGDEEVFAAQVDEMLTQLAPVDHVFWLTVAEFREDRREVNAVLEAAAARDRRLRLVDWNAVWADDASLTAADRLHLTPAGAARLARLVAEELAAAGLRPRPGAGRSEVVTAGTLPAGADGAVGDAVPRRSATTTTSVTTSSVAPSTTRDVEPEPVPGPSTSAPAPASTTTSPSPPPTSTPSPEESSGP